MPSDAIQSLLLKLGLIIEPLESAFSSPESAAMLLEELGFNLPSGLADIGLAGADVATVIQRLEAVINSSPADRDDISIMAPRYVELGRSVVDCIEEIADLAALLPSLPGLTSDYITRTRIDTQLLPRLLSYLIITYVRDRHYFLYTLLVFGGLFDIESKLADGVNYQPAHTRLTLRFDLLGDLLSGSGNWGEEVYGWGTSTADIGKLLKNLSAILETLTYATRYSPLPRVLEESIEGHPVPIADSDPMPMLNVPLLRGLGWDNLALGVEMIGLRASSVGTDAGLGLYPYVEGAVVFTFPLPFGDKWTLVLEADLKLEQGIVLKIRPRQPMDLQTNLFADGSSALQGSVKLKLRYSDPSGAPARVFSLPGGGGFELQEFSVGGGAGLVGKGEVDFLLEAAVRGGRFFFDVSEGDSFIGTLTGGEGFSVDFDFEMLWSRLHGLTFKGSAGLEVLLPTHIVVGPISINGLHIGLLLDSGGTLNGEISSSFTGVLGPLAVAVERMGIELVLSFPSDGSGNLGPADLAFKFKPPNGVGLAINAGVVKGGGYLYFDFDKGEYAGALELTVANFLSLKAIGLINTQLPGGQPGFSLLVIITAEFNPGLQLGFGFVLSGVGGLLGLNRAVLLDPLVQGVRTGALNSILFPTNIIANAPKILSDLRAIFPPEEGKFLIGPMAKIAWGSPALVTVSLGVIIEIPGNVVILGRLRLALPTDDEKAVLVIQISFMGALEFDKRRFWFFASMYESRVLFITIEGEMGLLMDFSENPNFILSVGGFHPRFTAPPLPFPSPARIALVIVNESWARVRAEAYFAITSNTVQMGVRADAFFGFDAFSVEGFFSFDALLQFSPFYLIVEISVGFSVKVFGIGMFSVHLRAALEGPTPWHISGSAEISLLFFSFSVDVDVTFGERRADALPPVEMLPLLLAEMNKLENWRAVAPGGGNLGVSLRDLGESGGLVLHPLGTLQISQRLAPLNLTWQKIGNQKPSDITKAVMGAPGGALTVKGATREKFAAAQFREMSDADKLSAPAFESLESGIELAAAGDGWTTGPMALRTVRYEVVLLETAYERYRTRFFKFWDGLFIHFRAGAAVARSEVSRASKARMQPFAEKVSVRDDEFTIAFQTDNRAYSSTTEFRTFTEAQAHMTAAVKADPDLSEAIHVIPSAEVNKTI